MRRRETQPPAATELSAGELASLIRGLTGREPSEQLVEELHQRVREDAARLVDVVACLVAAGPDPIDALACLATAAPPPLQAKAEVFVFRREGEYWTIAFDGVVVRLRDARGLRYLARLLAQPGEPVHALDLVGAPVAGGRRNVHRFEQARLSVTKALGTALARIATEHPALGVHLAATIRRGQQCAYVPDPRHPIRWLI